MSLAVQTMRSFSLVHRIGCSVQSCRRFEDSGALFIFFAGQTRQELSLNFQDKWLHSFNHVNEKLIRRRHTLHFKVKTNDISRCSQLVKLNKYFHTLFVINIVKLKFSSKFNLQMLSTESASAINLTMLLCMFTSLTVKNNCMH